MPYLDGNPTLGEQLEEDERMRFYTADILKEAREMNDEIKALRADVEALAVLVKIGVEATGPDRFSTSRTLDWGWWRKQAIEALARPTTYRSRGSGKRGGSTG